MPVIADVHISHPELVLTPTIREGPDVTLRVISDSSTDPETRLFSFLVSGGDFDAFESALDDDPTVDEYHRQATFDDSRIYQLHYGEGIKLISPKTSEVGGLIIEAVSENDGWNVQLQLPDRQALSELYDYCNEEGITLQVNNVYGEAAVSGTRPVGVTEAQREALLAAYEKGYFKQPREVSLDELSEELDISSTAAGGRLRRGVENLVETTLVEDGTDPE